MRSEFARPQDDAREIRFGTGVLIVLTSAFFALVAMPITALADEAPADAAPTEEAVVDANSVGAPMACGELAAERYPFLTCVRGPSGGPVFASVGDSQSDGHIKIRSKFVRAKGHWGPSGIE